MLSDLKSVTFWLIKFIREQKFLNIAKISLNDFHVLAKQKKNICSKNPTAGGKMGHFSNSIDVQGYFNVRLRVKTNGLPIPEMILDQLSFAFVA